MKKSGLPLAAIAVATPIIALSGMVHSIAIQASDGDPATLQERGYLYIRP